MLTTATPSSVRVKEFGEWTVWQEMASHRPYYYLDHNVAPNYDVTRLEAREHARHGSMDWRAHMSEKNWVTPQCADDFIAALTFLLATSP